MGGERSCNGGWESARLGSPREDERGSECLGEENMIKFPVGRATAGLRRAVASISQGELRRRERGRLADGF